ncbi:hypothetical protein [Lysinibacillus sp. C5.1]|uniref:hypothetical protein n=1 Tax=Lysinibacillus sp. C5.1 TaxID=2796169 RepID=UPI0030818A19
MMYRIAYIDDEEDLVRQFQINTMEDFDVIELELRSDITEMQECIISSDISALVVDFLLNDTKPEIHYNGVELVEKIIGLREDFPIFILTSHEIEAENTSINPDVVYSKALVNQDPNRFNRKIKRKIENHNKEIEDARSELLELIAKSADLTLTEEERLIELDGFLEKSSNKITAIPEHAKELSYNKRLTELIDKTEQLLKAIKES